MDTGVASKAGGVATLGVGSGVGVYCATGSSEDDSYPGPTDGKSLSVEIDEDYDFRDLDSIYYAYKYSNPSGKYLVTKLSNSITSEESSKSSTHVKNWCDEKKGSIGTDGLEKVKFWCNKKKIGDNYSTEGKVWNDSIGDFIGKQKYEKILADIGEDEDEKEILERILKEKGNDKDYAASAWCWIRDFSIVEDENRPPRWLNIFMKYCLETSYYSTGDEDDSDG